MQQKLAPSMFYLDEAGEQQDAALHDAIIEEGENAAALAVGLRTMRACGLTAKEIDALMADQTAPSQQSKVWLDLRCSSCDLSFKWHRGVRVMRVVCPRCLEPVSRFSPDQPRDESGRWTDGGGGTGGSHPSPSEAGPSARDDLAGVHGAGEWSSAKGLAAEAVKAGSFEQFKHDFSVEIKHGIYWHFTNEKDFKIDPEKGPRDMSSMGSGEADKGALMITSDLAAWEDYGPSGNTRPYVAQIDMRNVPRSQFYQVNRGFGNEFFVTPDGAKAARVVSVVSPQQARHIDERHDKSLPQSDEELRKFYDKAIAEGQQSKVWLDLRWS